jgi:hypothetical protein
MILLKIAKQIQIHPKKIIPSFFRKNIFFWWENTQFGTKVFIPIFWVIEHLANFPSAKLVGLILGKN